MAWIFEIPLLAWYFTRNLNNFSLLVYVPQVCQTLRYVISSFRLFSWEIYYYLCTWKYNIFSIYLSMHAALMSITFLSLDSFIFMSTYNKLPSYMRAEISNYFSYLWECWHTLVNTFNFYSKLYFEASLWLFTATFLIASPWWFLPTVKFSSKEKLTTFFHLLEVD